MIPFPDILDTWECSDWLPRTLGQLRAREGVWFILGTHDLRPGRVADLRRMLTELGLTDLGGQCRVMTVRGIEVLAAGNECPWFEPAPLVPLPAESPRPFRLLLSHTPDQWEWARRHHFDLMLAGHTHGGQICFPLLGPIVAPSRYGVEYAGGLFEFGSLVMHVCRGLSAEEPLRWRCPPELPRLILRADNG